MINMSFGPITIQPLATLNFRNTCRVEDTAGTDHRDEEVRGMNEDHRRAQREWDREHQ